MQVILFLLNKAIIFVLAFVFGRWIYLRIRKQISPKYLHCTFIAKWVFQVVKINEIWKFRHLGNLQWCWNIPSSNLISLSVSSKGNWEQNVPKSRKTSWRECRPKLIAHCNNWNQTMSVQIIQIWGGQHKEILSEKEEQEESDQNKNKRSDRSPYNVICLKINGQSGQKLMKNWLSVMPNAYQEHHRSRYLLDEKKSTLIFRKKIEDESKKLQGRLYSPYKFYTISLMWLTLCKRSIFKINFLYTRKNTWAFILKMLFLMSIIQLGKYVMQRNVFLKFLYQILNDLSYTFWHSLLVL